MLACLWKWISIAMFYICGLYNNIIEEGIALSLILKVCKTYFHSTLRRFDIWIFICINKTWRFFFFWFIWNLNVCRWHSKEFVFFTCLAWMTLLKRRFSICSLICLKCHYVFIPVKMMMWLENTDRPIIKTCLDKSNLKTYSSCCLQWDQTKTPYKERENRKKKVSII